MKIDKKNYSAFKENDSLKDKRLQELFDGIRKPAVITPPDIVSQCMVAVPMWLLYEMGLLVARVSCPSDRRAPRKKKEKKPVCPTGRPRKPVCPTGRQKVVKRTKQTKRKKKKIMTTKTIHIPEDVVKDIQEKNADVTVCMQTLNDLVNAHYADEETTFFDSPVIAKLRDKASGAQIAFDNAKNALVENADISSGASGKEAVLSGLAQELSDIRTSDDSLSDMSEDEISSAVELLHEKGMRYEEIKVQDLRHADDAVPEVRIYTREEFDRMTLQDRVKTGVMALIGDEPKSPLVFWVLPERIENGYNISTISNTGPQYLYDWNYAKANYLHDFDYLSRDEEGLLRCIGKTYSEWGASDFNTYTSYRGLDADEYLAPGEEGRFVLLRWFRFVDSDKRGWAVCYVDVVNNSGEKRAKRDCPMTQILFDI